MEVSRGVVVFGGTLEDYPFLIGLSRPQPLWVVGVVNSEGVVARLSLSCCRSVTQFLHFGGQAISIPLEDAQHKLVYVYVQKPLFRLS